MSVERSVRDLCEYAVNLLRGKRLILDADEEALLEALDYQALAERYAQDEAVVCAMNFARVRDRLLEIYPWTFARYESRYMGYIPSDCMALLCVTLDGEPVEYECNGGALTLRGVPEDAKVMLHYTRRVEDVTEWSGIYSEVFVYTLAIEICASVTGKPEYAQMLETKAQELIQRAYQIGAIKAETRLPLSEEIYNRAIALSRGVRSVKETSGIAVEQGLDVSGDVNGRTNAEVQACKRASESVRDRLLSLYAWRFARRSVFLTDRAPGLRSWSHGDFLPDDCLSVLSVASKGEVLDYEVINDCVYIEEPIEWVELRYTSRVKDMSLWPGLFTDIYVYQLAQEILLTTTGNLESVTALEQKSQLLLRDAQRLGLIEAETRIPPKEELFRRAISLAHGSRTLKPSSVASVDQGTDNYGDINYLYREELSICKRAYEYQRDKLLRLYGWVFARVSVNLSSCARESGWKSAYMVPEDCIKVLCVLFNDEAVEYEQAGDKILCDASGNVSLRYTRCVREITELEPVFKEVLSCMLAEEVITGTNYNGELIQLLETKAQGLIQNAYRTGIIRDETKIPLKDELYRRAIGLVHGYRTLKPSGSTAVEQGTDNAGDVNARLLEEQRVCRESSSGVRNKLLSLYAWVFARKSVELTGSAGISGWASGYTLPSDCMRVLTVLHNGEPVDYEVIGGKVYANAGQITLRYTRQVEDAKEWPASFTECYICSLAIEISLSTVMQGESGTLATILTQKLLSVITDAYKVGAIKAETRIPAKHELYNRAIGLVKGIKTGSPDVIDWRYEDELSACRRCFDSVRDRLLQMYEWVFARRSDTPAQLSERVPGWRYTYLLPEDCLKVVSVIAKDRRGELGLEHHCIGVSELSENVELLNYETAGRELYVNHSPVYVRYTARISNYEEWTASFTEVFVYLLAIEVAMNVCEDKQIIQLLERRVQELIEEARRAGLIRPESGLYTRRDSTYRGAREVPYLDYSGIPTLVCTPLDYCCGRLEDEGISG